MSIIINIQALYIVNCCQEKKDPRRAEIWHLGFLEKGAVAEVFHPLWGQEGVGVKR